MSDDENDVTIRYERRGDLIRFTCVGATNHEIRAVLVGMWSRLSYADRADHIRELTHYQQDPDSWLPPVASRIADPQLYRGFVDLIEARRVEHGDLPS